MVQGPKYKVKYHKHFKGNYGRISLSLGGRQMVLSQDTENTTSEKN